MSTQTKNSLLLLLCSLIWGTAFVAQSAGSGMGAYSFLAGRSWLAVLVLIPTVMVFDAIRRKSGTDAKPKTAAEKKKLLAAGFVCGTLLFAASAAQQIGITINPSTAKAGFLTAMYVVLVPVCGLFAGRRQSWLLWASVGLASLGLYFLCATGGALAMSKGDLLVLLGALGFTAHILIIDHYSPKVDGVKMSCIQFGVSSVLALVCMALFEQPHWGAIVQAGIPLLYTGIFSCGVAYTLQILGQKSTDPTVASLILCLESVFAVVFSWLISGEKLSARELFGCGMMFIAIVMAQFSGAKAQAKQPRTKPQGNTP